MRNFGTSLIFALGKSEARPIFNCVVIFKFRNLNSGQATPIPPGEFTVGRDERAYVQLEDGSISRLHAKIYNAENGFFVEDLGSSNGSAVHGSLITGRQKIEFGDVIYLGSVPFRVDPEMSAEPEALVASGMRPVNRASMRRDTERITLNDPARDSGALLPPSFPIARPGGTPVPKVVPTPTATATPRQPEIARVSAAPVAVAQPVKASTPAPVSTFPAAAPTAAAVPAAGSKWMMLILFLAGMGVGLLAGLYFARVFIEMGGKAAGLP